MNTTHDHPRLTLAEDGGHEVRGALTGDVIEALAGLPAIERLSLRDGPRITRSIARQWQAKLPPTRWLWLWCDVSRIAMRHVLAIPGLETLDVLRLCAPGKLSGFEQAVSLHTLRANCRLESEDLLAIARCTSLRELGLQSAALDKRSLDALLSLPDLRALDLEGTAFTDSMARRASRSTTLESLDLGATRITRSGLESLVRMPALKRLDLWATDLSIDDLALLKEAPALEYVSVGDYMHQPITDGDRLVEILLSMPALKSAWLDGVALSPEQERVLKSGIPQLRVS